MAKELIETMKVRLTFTDEILGTLPGDSEVYKNYLIEKARKHNRVISQEREDEELAALDPGEEYEKGVTIFAKEDGNPFAWDYMIKGFFKNACKAMRENSDAKSAKLTSYKTKIDNCVMITPVKILYQGVTADDLSICERPLRAQTPQGERIALAASEQLPSGAYLEFEIHDLSGKMMSYIPEWLDYGRWNGLGQWHNSGKGRFTWEDITDESSEKKAKRGRKPKAE